MSKKLTKDRLLLLASQEQGVRVHYNDREQQELVGRLKILHLRGFVSMKYEKNHLHFKLTKDTYLL